MNREINSLLLKSNRVLGSRIVEAGLQSMEQIDKANKRFVEHVRNKELALASLLRVLIYETQTLDEKDYIEHVFDHMNLGGIYLHGYDIDTTLYQKFGLDVCQATWTLPVDLVDDHYFIATSYYISDIVQQFWKEKLGSHIHWFMTTIQDMENQFELLIQTVESENPQEA